MDPAAAADRNSALHRAVFEDGLGKRHHAVTPGGEPLEVLELRYELSNEACEAALRERVSASAGVHSACFARVRGVQRINQNTAKLFILSDRVNGARLSSVLASARQTMVALDVNASLCLIRQLVSAVAILHEKMPKFAHGAIAPERIIVTPEARLVVVDHAVGAVLPQLRYSHERYWKEMRVHMPVDGEPAFGHRTDVMQVGIVALELLLGRPVERVEYPDHVDELTQRAWRFNANSGTNKQLTPQLREWLMRMLQIDKERSFSSVGSAWEELESVLGGGMGASFTALENVMAEYARKAAAAPPAAPAQSRTGIPVATQSRIGIPVASTTAAPPKPPATPAASTPPPPAAAAPVAPKPVTPAPVAPAPVAPTRVAPAPVAPAPAAAAAVGATPLPATPIASDRKPSMPKKPVDPAIASGYKPSVASTSARIDPERATVDKQQPSASSGDTSSARVESEVSLSGSSAEPMAPGRLVTPSVVTSHIPAGVKTFLAADESAEQSADEPATRGRGKWLAFAAMIAVIAGGGAFFSRMYLVPPAAAEAPGTLVVTTTPAGVNVIVDGQQRGVTPLTLELAPGSHELKLAADGAEPRIIPFTVTAGNTVAQTLEFAKAAPTSGQLTIRTDPPGARVTIDGMAVGTTPMNIESLTPGHHSVVLASDVSTVTQEVTIEAGTTASLVVPMGAPQGVPVSGWISVSSPKEVQIYEESQLLGTSATDRIMVSAGKHEFTIVNDAFGYRTTRSVVVTAGKVSPVKIDWPTGSMALNAQPWAEVWVDGERVGETPIGNHSVPIGNHEVIFRHPELGEQVVRATVTATAPARVSVDMRKR